MNDDVHHRALAAAMRLCLTGACGGLVVLPACEPRETTAPVATTPATPSTATEPSRVPDDATVTASHDYGRNGVDPLPEGMSCAERLDNALPQGGDDFTSSREVARRTKSVVNCCADLVKVGSWSDAHFGDCCSIVQGQIPDADVPQACTPWGPAVPPAMDWANARRIA